MNRSLRVGEVRAIFDATDVYAWNPTLAPHDEVLKAPSLDENSIYEIMNVESKTLRVVRGSSLGKAVQILPTFQEQ